MGIVVTDAVSRAHAERGLRANLLLLLTSLGVALVALEIVARTTLPAPPPWRYPQLHYRSDPALIFALAPDQRAFTADKLVAVNARGLRGQVIPYERTPGRLRLLFLGDSITFGYGVDDAEVVTARVASLLNDGAVPAEVINSSVPAYNTEQEVAYLESAGVRYAPDWVVVGVCWNDINDKSGARVSPEGGLISEADGARRPLADVTESGFAYTVRNTLKRSRLMYGALQGWRALPAMFNPDSLTVLRSDVLEGRETLRVTEGWQRLAGAIRRIRQLSEKHGFRVLLVAFPIPLAVERSFPRSSYPARLQDLAERQGLPMIDLQGSFRAAYRGHESLFIPYDGDHPNAAGHDIAAREIVRFLVASGPLRSASQSGS